MPHFIIECNKSTAERVSLEVVTQKVFDTAVSSGLFARSNIKARAKVYDVSIVAGEDHDFFHVWGYIREGRSDDKKRQLSENIVNEIKSLYPGIFLVSCDIRELDEASYFKYQI